MRTRLLSYMKGYLEKYKLYLLAREVKWSIQYTLKQFNELGSFSLRPEKSNKKNILFSYPPAFTVFSLGRGQAIPNTHTNYWFSVQMAKTFLDLGYCVDVINPHN